MDFFDPRSVPLWAAFFAGVVSMVGLIIAKEQRVSDFRQAWIDALRCEIASLIARVNAINEWRLAIKQRRVKGTSGGAVVGTAAADDVAEQYKLVHPDVLKMEEALATIELRLNPKEDKAKPLLQKAEAVVRKVRLDKAVCRETLKRVEKELLDESKTYLKDEWERVKRGETWYWWAVRITTALAVIGFGLFLLGLVAWLMEETATTPVETVAAQVTEAREAENVVTPEGGEPEVEPDPAQAAEEAATAQAETSGATR